MYHIRAPIVAVRSQPQWPWIGSPSYWLADLLVVHGVCTGRQQDHISMLELWRCKIVEENEREKSQLSNDSDIWHMGREGKKLFVKRGGQLVLLDSSWQELKFY